MRALQKRRKSALFRSERLAGPAAYAPGMGPFMELSLLWETAVPAHVLIKNQA
jgi:hypothetical protein